MSIEINSQLNDHQLSVLEKIITEIEERAEKCCFSKNKIYLSIKDNELFIDEMILEGWTRRDKNMVVEYNNIFFDDMLEDLKSRVDNYDVSYETYIWLDNEGHGTNGAPYDMLECYKDSEEELEHLEDLELSLSSLAVLINTDSKYDFSI